MQVIINGLISFGYFSLVGVGFALAYRTCRFINFAHGFVATCAGYLCYAFLHSLDWPIALAILLAVCGTLAVSTISQEMIFSPLMGKRTVPAVIMIASLGVYTVLQNAVSLLFGDDTKILSHITSRSVNIFGARITTIQLWLITVAVSFYIVLFILQRTTSLGLRIRSIAGDPELASTVGINVRRTRLAATLIGTVGGALAGIFWTIDIGLTPSMGMYLLLMGAVAALVGRATLLGTLTGALLISFLQEFSALWFQVKWKDCPVFVVLIVCLMLWRKGGLGKVFQSVQ